MGTFLISTKTGEGRRLLGKDERGTDFTPDGNHLVYWIGSSKGDLGVLDIRDGSTRRLTSAPANVRGYGLTADGKTVVVSRSETKRRIVIVDMTKALAKEPQ